MKEIKVIEVMSGEVLQSFSLSQQDDAYTYATQMEQLGLDVKITSPSLPETLAISLGKKNQDIQNLREEIEQEIDSHQNCCTPDSEIPS